MPGKPAPYTAAYRGHDGALLSPGWPELRRILMAGLAWLWVYLLVSNWPRAPWPRDLPSALAWLLASYIVGLTLDLCARFLLHQLVVRRLLARPSWTPLSPALARHVDGVRAGPRGLADEEVHHAVLIRIAKADPCRAKMISARQADGFLAADLCLALAFNAVLCGLLGYWIALVVLLDLSVLLFLRSVVASADVQRLTSVAAVTILSASRRHASH